MRKVNILLSFLCCMIMTGCAGTQQFAFSEVPEQEDTKTVVSEQETAEPAEAGRKSAEVKSDTQSGSVDAEQAYQEGDVQSIFVHVTGEVEHPGVYELEPGARVFEAIQQAGGMTVKAAQDCVNQAQPLTDGQMICILSQAEYEAAIKENGDGDKSTDLENRLTVDSSMQAMPSQQEDGRININTADTAQLKQIPGIGDVRAGQIITYRQQHGPFQKVEDIKQIEGIGDGLLEQIRAYIKV